MEKYGCNRLEEIGKRIDEIRKVNYKTASEQDELKDLLAAKEEIESEKE